MHIAARAEGVRAEVEDGVCDELARTVEGSLAPAESSVDGGGGETGEEGGG